ncbi:MAG: aminotransferase class III-fold pyridoxal phosphate-dependent enzyme [Rectinemataceae bacterium]|nr:aminotransferase class III-fold pyridoxal phosphate-dependent enzyme [Rectinemataceae bacterium]
MRSDDIFQKAKNYMVGGVSAGGRYHRVLQKPLILESADGCIMKDVDGREWIDFHSCSGATLLGFNHPSMREALQKSLELGFFINFESPYHTELAEQVSRMLPCAQKVRLANSGTEATLAALRLAREYSGRRKVIKFEGHFHGMHEFVFYNWHNKLGAVESSGEIQKIRDTAGMVPELDDLLIVIPFNDIEVFEKTVKAHRGEIAAVIMEPIMYNAGCIEPRPSYLQRVREITKKENIVLIFDEVLSGFRMGRSSAQGYYGVTPDLTTLGKVLGNGMGIAALAGSDEVMRHLNPIGPVVMSGTYTSPLMGVMAGLAGLKVLDQPGFYDRLNSNANYFYGRVNSLFRSTGLKGILLGLGARFGLFFGLDHATYDYREAASLYRPKSGRRFVELATGSGMYFHDYGDGLTPMHSGITSAHSKEILDVALGKIEDIFRQMVREGF